VEEWVLENARDASEIDGAAMWCFGYDWLSNMLRTFEGRMADSRRARKLWDSAMGL
jgi:hypothetical protein